MDNTSGIIGIFVVIYILWMAYVMWSAPLMKENQDGSWTTLRGERKLKDLFKRKK